MPEELLTNPRSLLMVALVLVVVGVGSFVVFVSAAIWLARRPVNRPSEDTTVAQRVAASPPAVAAKDTQPPSRARVTPWAPPPVGTLRSIAPVDGRTLLLDERLATGEPPADPHAAQRIDDEAAGKDDATQLLSKEEVRRRFSQDKLR